MMRYLLKVMQEIFGEVDGIVRPRFALERGAEESRPLNSPTAVYVILANSASSSDIVSRMRSIFHKSSIFSGGRGRGEISRERRCLVEI